MWQLDAIGVPWWWIFNLEPKVCTFAYFLQPPKPVEGPSCVASSISGTIAAKMAQFILDILYHFHKTVNQHNENIESQFFPIFLTRTRPLGVGFLMNPIGMTRPGARPRVCRWLGAIKSVVCPGLRSSCPSLKAGNGRNKGSACHVDMAGSHLENMIWLVVWNITVIFPYIGNNHPN